MKIILNNNSLFKSLRPFNDIGFVPTMGSIHEGHLSLIDKSNRTCKKTIVSIFVNPKQFNNKKDFKNYPTNIKKDIKILKKTKKVDFLYIPKFKDIYNNSKKSNIKIAKKDKVLCAKYREGHFEGVLNVMNRLMLIIKSKDLFMGEKDFQQIFLIRKFLSKKFNARINSCPTIRTANKIALSTRNKLLNKKFLQKASQIAKFLIKIKNKSELYSTKSNLNLSDLKKELEKKFNRDINDLNQETESLVEEIEKWRM